MALTTHLVVNDKIITQAPSLKGANIFVRPPQQGSWEIIATISIFGAGIYKLGTTSKDTVVGHLVRSVYDYAIRATLGFHVDYNKSLGQQYEELKQSQQNEIPILTATRVDSLIEKCEGAIENMHRPIINSKTAQHAEILYISNSERKQLMPPLNAETYEYMHQSRVGDEVIEITGRVSSFNINTLNGRIFVPDEGRPISFELADQARSAESVVKITDSLNMNARTRFTENMGDISCAALQYFSRNGRLRKLRIVGVK